MPALSASRLKTLIDCSWLFYQTYFEKVPEKVWAKTAVGDWTHRILECLANPRHRKTLDFVMRERSIHESDALRRMVRRFRWQKPEVSDEIAGDLNDLVFVALDHDFERKGAVRVLPPEHAFTIDFGEFSIKGFMDRVTIYENVAVITDYKSQGRRFQENQLVFNLQAFFYQTAIKHEFNLPATVEFVMLRFPPTKRDPQRHLQRIAPFTDAQLTGFRYYLGYLNQEVNALTVETAKRNYKADHDRGFCDRVCSLRHPKNYQAVLKGDKLLRGALIDDEVVLAEGERLEVRRYHGCAYFYPQPDLT